MSENQPESEFAKTRRQWRNALDDVITQSNIDGQSVSVILADLNNLKWLNDTVGHNAGDSAIEIAEQILASHTHSSSRIGGDEFAAFSFATQEEAALIAEQIRAEFAGTINSPWNEDLKGAGVGLAVGASTAGPGSSSSELLHEADHSMYEDKMHQSEFSPKEIEAFEEIQQLIAERLAALGFKHRERDFGRFIVQQARRRK